MCRPSECLNDGCHKTTWYGCGLHIPFALRGVPEDDLCECPPEKHNPSSLPPRSTPPVYHAADFTTIGSQ